MLKYNKSKNNIHKLGLIHTNANKFILDQLEIWEIK